MSVFIVKDTDPEVIVSLRVSCCHPLLSVVIVNDTDPEVTVSLKVSCCHGYCLECCDNNDIKLPSI